MNLLCQQIQLAESAEDILRLVADAWRTGGCPDVAFAIEMQLSDIGEERIEVGELTDRHAKEIEDLKEAHEAEVKKLNEEIKALKNPE